MSGLSFEIRTSQDLLNKLKEEINDCNKELTSSRHAINAAMTAFHLCEWIYHEYGMANEFGDLKSFVSSMKKQCPELQIVHDISNGSKHFLLDRHKPKVQDTHLKKGAFSSDFSRDFDVSILRIEMNDELHDFVDVIERVFDFWVRNIDVLKNKGCS